MGFRVVGHEEIRQTGSADEGRESSFDQRVMDNLLHRTQILNPLDSGGYQFLIAC